MNTRIHLPYMITPRSKGMLLKIASGILLLLLLVGGILWQVKSPLLPQWICPNCGSSTLTYPTIYMARHTDISQSGLNPPPIQTFLYAINGQSGKVQQTINLHSTSHIYYQKIINGVNYELFSDQSNSILVATTFRDRTTRWRDTLGSQFISVVADSSTLYLYGSSSVIAINLQNGAQLWEDEMSNINDIRLADTTLIVQKMNEDDIVALSAKNGQEIWKHTNSTNNQALTPIIEDGHAFFGYYQYPSGTQQGQLSLLERDERSGQLLWQNKIELGNATASFAIRDHCILIETTNKKLTVLRETDKSVLWSYTPPSSYNSAQTQSNLWFYSDDSAYSLSTEIDPQTFASKRIMTAWRIDNGKKLFQTIIDIKRDFNIYHLNDLLLFTSTYTSLMGQPDSNTEPLSNDIEARQAQTGKLLWHKHLGQLPAYKGGTAWKLSLVETSDTHSDDCSGVVCPYNQDLQGGDDLDYRPATDLHSYDQGFTTFYIPSSGEQKQSAMYVTLYEEASKSYMLYAVDPRNGATLWQLMPDTLSARTIPMVTEFSLPTAANVPESITVGPDGNLWFTETTSTTSIQQHEPQIGKIGRITPAGKISEFSLPEGTLPEEITAGADGNLWFTENQDDQAGKIGRITPAGKISEFVLPPLQGAGPNKSSRPHGITAGRDGNLWFTEVFGDNVGRITPTGQITEFPLPSGSQPGAITAGPDGNLWFVNSGLEVTSDTIGRITPSGELALFPDPSFSGNPYAITSGPDHNLWFVELAANQITRITPLGMMNEFILPTSGSMPLSITAGQDGNLWFTSSPKNQIGRITPTGQITEFTLPTFGSQSNDITSGPDGNLWFTEVGGDQVGKIGRIVTASIIGVSANQSQIAQQNATATADAQHRADQQNAHATATPNAIQRTQTMNGTWEEQDNEGVSSWNITQSQSSITGDGTTLQGVHVTISGSVHNQSVTIVEHATGNNCSDTYTLTVNQKNTEMDGSMYSGCNGQSYTGIIFKKQ